MMKPVETPPEKPGHSRRQARSNTRQNILAAARTVLSEDGVQKATVRRIAKQADISPGLVIQVFGSKAKLIHEIFRAGNRPLSEYLHQHLDQFNSPQEMVMGALADYLRRDLEDPELTRQVMAFAWTWSAENEASFTPNLAELTDILGDALTQKFYPDHRNYTRTATYTLISAFAGVLRMGLQKNWSHKTYMNVLEPSVTMILVGLDGLISTHEAQD